MPCGCSDNKRSDNNMNKITDDNVIKITDDNVIKIANINNSLDLDSIKDMPIDNIINLYRQGYRLGQGYSFNDEEVRSLSPCSVAAVQFTKNGSTNIPGCTATLADDIGFDATVSFTPADADKSYFCWFDIYYPNGTSKSFYTSTTPAYIGSAGTYDFTMSNIIKSTDPVGKYSIISCYIYLPDINGNPDPLNRPCYVYPANGPGCLASDNYCPAGICQNVPTITVTSVPTTIVNGEFLIGGARQNTNCSDNTTDISNISVKITINNLPSIGLDLNVGFVITDDNGAHQTSGWLHTSNTSLNQDFTIPLSNAAINTLPGTHDFVNFKAVNAQNAGIVYAQGLGAGQGCQSLTLIAPTPTPTPTPMPGLTTIILSPSTATLSIGDIQTFVPTCKDQSNNTISCPTISWSVVNTAIGSISQSGVFTALSAGTTTVRATVGTIVGTATVTVTTTTPTPTPTPTSTPTPIPTPTAGMGAGIIVIAVAAAAAIILMKRKP